MRAAALESIVAPARHAAPDECCGLLLGRGGDIIDALRTQNIANQRASRFVIDPGEHIRGRRAARERGLEVVGFYHSHPATPAEPSERDSAECSYPGHLYLIVSLRVEPAEIGLFRFENGTFQRVPFVNGRSTSGDEA